MENSERQPYDSDAGKSEYHQVSISEKSRVVAILLCYLFGVFGAHRFYVDKIGTGVLWLLTLGLFGIGVVVDLILLILGHFRDKDGAYVRIWFD